ncbi:uncharacterized protein LOC142257859 [Anomaloglossus baeobatrachus]|uniref:uncharacterized protein LOC142257859 n=1 Tax=Anomaloglossus baeobatrachus TaxID=238106 RepID=UPI003F50BFE4
MALKQLAADDREGRLKLIQQYQDREAERAERQSQRDHEFKVLQARQQTSSSLNGESNNASSFKPRPEHFPVMEKDGDLDTFLREFEKTCLQYQLPPAQWARYLTPGLRGKALDVFASLLQEQSGDYEAIKQALIRKYQLTPEVYRKKFRTLQRGPHDSYSDVVDGLRTTFDQWIQGLSVTTFEELRDLMVKDQLLHLCPVEVRQFVMDQEPKEASKAPQIADTYEAKRASKVRKPSSASWNGGKVITTTTTPLALASRPPIGPVSSTSAWPTSDPCRCFSCNQPGHLSSACPERQKRSSTPEARGPSANVLFVVQTGGRACENRQPVTVGDTITEGLKDTGAEQTLIRPEFVLPSKLIPGKTLTVTGVWGVRQSFPMARVFLDWGAVRGWKDVGVSRDIPANVLLGTDLGRLVAHYVPDNLPQSDKSCDTNVVDKSCDASAVDNLCDANVVNKSCDASAVDKLCDVSPIKSCDPNIGDQKVIINVVHENKVDDCVGNFSHATLRVTWLRPSPR